MSVAPTLQRYLDRNVTYDVVQHEPTASSMRTAQACHISGKRLAKAVVLRRDGGFMLAVLPASRHVRMADLAAQLGEAVQLATENEIGALFSDCARGAVPPIGACYDIDWIVDDSIEGGGDVYLEAGDHMTLIRLPYAQFAKLAAEARHGRFSA